MPSSDYQFVECQSSDCSLRFPGAPEVRCPICKTETTLVATRARGYHGTSEHKISTLEILIDNVRSAFNVGSIIRSAEGAGIQAIHICGISPTPDHPSVKKTSLGAETNMKWSHHFNALACAQQLKKERYTIWSLERSEHSINIQNTKVPDKESRHLLIVGNEVTGVDPALLQLSDKTVHIPMRGQKISLNVATAAGIAMYALT